MTQVARQYHVCYPHILQRPSRNKLATERYVNRSSWYLFRSLRLKTVEQP